MNNMGCDKTTGYSYPCKKHVTGERCDMCKPGYFGLHADDENGCQPCNCAPGNSYTNQCDQVTGQCSCKPNTFGRRCNVFEEGFYCPSLDHLIFEGKWIFDDGWAAAAAAAFFLSNIFQFYFFFSRRFVPTK